MLKFISNTAGLLFCCAITGCSSMTVTEVKKVETIGNLDWPESVLVDEATDTIYISNIETIDVNGWGNDGKGFITAIVAGGKITKERWVDSRPWNILNAPKGMTIKDNKFYVADNNRLLTWPIKMPDPAKVIRLPGAKKLNDVVSDENFIYISDTEQGIIYKIALKNGRVFRIQGPEGVNGLAIHDDKLYAVSVSIGEIYEVDKFGKKPPRPVGLNKYFKGLDSIEFFEDGSCIVSDLRGHKLFSVDSDFENVVDLADIRWPSDIGVDRKHHIIYVPMLKNSRVVKFEY